jgi:P4 family phage/plasmid primase-like protien
MQDDDSDQEQTELYLEKTLEDAVEVLEANDGSPVSVLRDDILRPALATWKHDDDCYDFDEFMEAVNWRAVAKAKDEFKSDINDEIEHLYGSDDQGPPSPDGRDFEEFRESYKLKEMDDRKKAKYAYNWIRAEVNILAFKEEGRDGQILMYEGGVWETVSESHLDQLVNELLGTYSGRNISKEVEKQWLKAMPATTISTDEVGLDSGYVAVENGLFNLHTGEIERDLHPDDYAITRIPWEYNPDADCPNFKQFLSESVEPGKVDLVQEYMGYCLYRGEMPYAKALMLVGSGSNGKSTFLKILVALLGEDNVMNASLSKLAGSRFSAYRLEGKLANINADIEGGKIEETSMFKNMTGGDSFEVEQKYGDPYDYRNTAKLVFAANEMPEVDTHQDAFFRRWLLVAFPNKFTKAEDDGHPMADPQLEDKLMDEMEGVLNFAVEGFQRLVEQDGQFTNELKTAEVREQWHQYGDPIDQFIRNWLETDEGRAATPTSELYRYYDKFMQDIPSTPVEKSTLTKAIRDRIDNPHYDRYRDEDGNQYRGFNNVHVRHDRM